jgi:hypothetical protein
MRYHGTKIVGVKVAEFEFHVEGIEQNHQQGQ